jgi:hypothetical protein
MRRHFNKLFPASDLLRRLASEISSYQCAQARQNCFFSAKPPPFNFLANGEVTGCQPVPPINCPLEIAEWKFPKTKINCCLAQGFNDESSSNKGLAVLFDPLVDAVLNANIGKGNSPQSGSTVIVLSDYGAIGDADINLISYKGGDWGKDEAEGVFDPKRFKTKLISTTEKNLWDCICDGKDWKSSSEILQAEIHQHRILIWNFMPFLRGGADSSDLKALPKPSCLGWLQICMNWLGDFVDSTGAGKVVFCVNKTRMIKISSTHDNPISLSDFNTPKNLRGITPGQLAPLFNEDRVKSRVFVLNHPGAWNRKDKDGRSFNDCPSLKKILGIT